MGVVIPNSGNLGSDDGATRSLTVTREEIDEAMKRLDAGLTAAAKLKDRGV